MSLLPGVPNMGPAPVSPTIKVSGKASLGGPSGIAKTAQSTGKPGNTENLGSLIGRMGKGSTSAGGGNPVAHSISQYGKGINGLAGGTNPTAHAGAKMIRGTAAGPHVKRGGLGSGPQGMPGPNSATSSGDPGSGAGPAQSLGQSGYDQE